MGPAPGPTNNGDILCEDLKHIFPPVSSLSATTSRSAGLDLPTRVTVQISESDPLVAIRTGIRGSIPSGTVGLILALTIKVPRILPGLIDPDYSGEINGSLSLIPCYSSKSVNCLAPSLALPYA